MTQEDKQLLLKDLCARLPYGLMFQSYHSECGVEGKGTFDFKVGDDVTLSKLKHLCETDNNKPYLRPMSSMTEEEINDLVMHVVDGSIIYDEDTNLIIGFECNTFEQFALLENWLNEHYFDYHGLIEKGLAIEAPEGMYKTE